MGDTRCSRTWQTLSSLASGSGPGKPLPRLPEETALPGFTRPWVSAWGKLNFYLLCKVCSMVFCLLTCGSLVDPVRQKKQTNPKQTRDSNRETFQHLLGQLKGHPDLAQLGSQNRCEKGRCTEGAQRGEMPAGTGKGGSGATETRGCFTGGAVNVSQ